MINPVLAAARFGMGARREELDALSGNPKAALAAQLDRPLGPGFRGGEGGLPNTAQAMEAREEVRQTRKASAEVAREARVDVRELYQREVENRLHRGVATDTPFRERLVLFWSNHFTVSVQKANVVALAGVFEREAVAPFVTGPFQDLLKAAVRHPAMLIYLDQFNSIGPGSMAGQARARGLNENLAREVLELHTLGVQGGYTQDDVKALASVLTGWTVEPDPANRTGYTFNERRHQPGHEVLLGRRIEVDGAAEFDVAMERLANHPATAMHLATKLVRHFVADDPPRAAVERIAGVYRASRGDLKAVSLALLDLPEAWEIRPGKIKTPWEYMVSIGRAIGEMPERTPILGELKDLGQTPYAALSPAGWSDLGQDWIGPDALLRRIRLAQRIAGFVARAADARSLLDHTIRPFAPPSTTERILRAGSQGEALGLLFASAEFQRR